MNIFFDLRKREVETNISKLKSLGLMEAWACAKAVDRLLSNPEGNLEMDYEMTMPRKGGASNSERI